MRLGLEALQATDAVTMMGYFSGLLAEAYGEVGQAEEGLTLLGGMDSTREPYWEAELYRLKGELILRRGGTYRLLNDNQVEAEECFRQALTIARAQNAKSLELRATMSLARLLDQQCRREEARTMLAEIYGWFSEGFDTADLIDAKALLDQL